MTKRILATTTAIALGLSGMAAAQSTAPTDESLGTEAAQAGDAIVDTGEAAVEGTANAVESGVDATGDAAASAYGAASDTAAQLEGALTDDAVVMSSDGNVVGTIYRTDLDSGRVYIDIDTAMETSLERPGVENAAVRVSSLSLGQQGLMLDMTTQQFAAALETGPIETVNN
ncbi:hypothetical protein [Roseivivax sediminis]|uniref:PRC-barrel domain-containing protein n=1 Tax=Roseivivax sediminis TaxID=936889 RepID=A0A1I2AUP6_9RHOB|nr:hypothetical protein [Roseivivax sediminis]SFE46743.1 hypothetical protein SAMN04515678_11039 [Roseivivax sediminis]